MLPVASSGSNATVCVSPFSEVRRQALAFRILMEDGKIDQIGWGRRHLL
jgi:hypothetical protein